MNKVKDIEFLRIAQSVAREKNIKEDSVFEAMEQAILVSCRKKFGTQNEIICNIERKTGQINIFRKMEVVAEVENHFNQISVADAREQNPEIEVGGHILEELPPIDLSRISAQSAKQVIVQKIRDAERDKQYEEYKNRTGDIIIGVVKKAEYGNYSIDVGGVDLFLPRENVIKNESFRINERVKAYISKVEKNDRGPQIYLSRTDNQFLAKLFAAEVPEIYDGVIQIKAIAREPGSRAKIAVYTTDPSIDAVGSCVGVRGSRVQVITKELQDEKIDIVEWSQELGTFVVNALSPAEVSKIILDEENSRIEVVLPSDQLSLAIGRRGQNVRLASQLVGLKIDVMTEDEESKRRIEEFKSISELFARTLDVEEVLSQLLAAEGFTSVEQIAEVSISDLESIEGFDEDLAAELSKRANDHINKKKNQAVEERKKDN